MESSLSPHDCLWPCLSDSVKHQYGSSMRLRLPLPHAHRSPLAVLPSDPTHSPDSCMNLRACDAATVCHRLPPAAVGLCSAPGCGNCTQQQLSATAPMVEINPPATAATRRAVVAPILAYAANLHGMSQQQLEDRVRNQLRQRDHATLVDAVRSAQEDAFDADEFTSALDEHLREGRFRLVFVLDAVPAELTTLVAYLEHVTDKLVIDLIAVNSFNVGGTSAVLPQRVTPERHEVTVEKTRRKDSGTLYRGSDRFEATISQAPPQSREALHRLLEWARGLEERGYVTLETYEGKGAKRFTLLPRLIVDRRGLVTIWNDEGASIQFWRSVFDRKAPDFVERIGQLANTRVGQGNTIRDFSEQLLEALTEAYEQAATAQ